MKQDYRKQVNTDYVMKQDDRTCVMKQGNNNCVMREDTKFNPC
jgi:hypothetical protein